MHSSTEVAGVVMVVSKMGLRLSSYIRPILVRNLFGELSVFLMGQAVIALHAKRCRCLTICALTCAGAVPPTVLRAFNEPCKLNTS